MIRHIRLENWRAYRHLDLEVSPGTTFLVAPNGVGKSSLMEAVQWALSLGEVVDKGSMIRHSHNNATVIVVVATAGGEVTVQRSLRAKKARVSSDLKATVDGEPVSEDELLQFLGREWAADPRFVSRSAFLTEDLRREGEEPDLRSHLCRVHSLDDLQAAIAEVEPALTRLNRTLKAARSELTSTQSELDAARGEEARLVAEADEARNGVAAARAAHSTARQERDQALAAAGQRDAALAWDERRAALLRVVEPLLGQLAPQLPIDGALSTAERKLSADVEVLRAEQAQLSARLAAVEASLATLHDVGAACPVCLRELDDQSRELAEHLHQQTLTRVRQQLAQIDTTVVVGRLEALRRLERHAAALGNRPAVEGADDVELKVAAEADALSRLEAAAVRARETDIAAGTAAARAEALAAELSEVATLTRQYREIALLEAAKVALNGTITAVLDQQLGPVAEEVNRRWQAVFQDRPHLRLLPSGRMSRQVGGEELDFAAFSAGEQTVAKLMMRLTTLIATTSVPFCWVDEPLEHLDPRSRRLVGSTLAHLSASGGLEQIFVTTYEEPLARRLAELQPDRVRVQYLRTEHAR